MAKNSYCESIDPEIISVQNCHYGNATYEVHERKKSNASRRRSLHAMQFDRKWTLIMLFFYIQITKRRNWVIPTIT